jgi:hypothetical protein
MSITKAGQLVEYIGAAVAQAGATPFTEVRVRIGTLGATYKINRMQASEDARGLCLILETDAVPESLN